jgi:hypothetical protein
MRRFVATSLIAAAFAITGCSASVDPENDTDQVSAESSEISAWGRKLIGAWEIQKDYEFDFDALVLKSDGTYFTYHDIVCFAAPCDTGSAGTYKLHAPTGGGVIGKIVLRPKGASQITYKTVQGSDGTIKLQRDGAVAKFSSRVNFCVAVEQCAGQPDSVAVRCAAGYHSENTCTETHECSKTCIKDTPTCESATQGGETSCKTAATWKEYASADCASKGLTLGEIAQREMCGGDSSRYVDYKCCPATACTYDDPAKSYVGKSAEECALILFLCTDDRHYFSDACGCGCALN